MEIAKTIKRSRKLVYNAIKYFKTHKQVEKVQRKKKARKTSEKEDRIIHRLSTSNPFSTAPAINKQISNEHGIKVSDSTVRRRLNEFSLGGRIARKKPFVRSQNRKKRIDFCKKYGSKNIDFWKKVLWSDETKVNLFGSDGKNYVRRPKNQEINPRYTIKTVKHGGCSLMAWGAFSWHGVGPIIKIDGIMDQFKYKGILENHMLPFAEDHLPLTWIFMQDNDPKHKARSVTKWFSDQKIRVLDWPPQSPDLNPIENLWMNLKSSIKKENVKNKDQLWAALEKAWYGISPKTCKELVESLPRRCQQVIKMKGYPTKY